MKEPTMGTWRKRCLGLTMAALIMASAACSVLLDHNAAQCQTDGDCARFGEHPTCQGGVCVSSGLGPEGCFYGTPQSQADFENQCSTAACVPFDSCGRMGLCDGASDPDAALVPPPVEDAGATTSSSSGGGDAGGALPRASTRRKGAPRSS